MYNLDLFKQVNEQQHIDDVTKQVKSDLFEHFEQVPFPSWKRMKVKDTSVPAYARYNNQKILFHQQEGLSVKPLQGYLPEVTKRFNEKAYGPSEKHRLLTEVFSNSGTYIEVDADTIADEPVVLKYVLNKDNPILLDHTIIHVKENSQVSLVIDYTDEDVSAYHNGVLNIVAEKNAKVTVTKIQNYGVSSHHIYGAIAIIERDASVSYSSIDLGAGLSVTDYASYLLDENADSQVESVYLGDQDRKLDIGYNTYHVGRRTTSDITVKGALLDESRKVFRGNLFFAKGAKRAKGSEEEYVILLDERVQADAIPALMCDEDDVQGEHAASAGQIEESKLFYLMSRGLSEKEAKQLIIMASFAPIISKLPIHGLRDRIEEEVSVRLTSEL